MTINEFVTRHKITLTSQYTDRNPHMNNSENMDNYKYVLRRATSRMTLYFSKGFGHNGAEPTAAEVLECLASDCAGIENAGGFEQWCSEYGYDTDSRTAERTFKVCEKQAEKLNTFLGFDLYQVLLWKVQS